MAKAPTITVKHPDPPSAKKEDAHMVINASVYNPDKHTLVGKMSAEAKAIYEANYPPAPSEE